jgi:tRNA(fMet)-specific endonuclease VapC
MILLDTDICVEILRKNANVIRNREKYDDETAVSFLSVSELYYGAEKSSNPIKNHFLIEEFLLTLEVIQSDNEILNMFGRLKFQLYKQNLLLPDADIFIAATTYVKADKLITGNTKHFQRFANLVTENWI